MAGRKPKPTALKKLEGNPGKRPLNESEPLVNTAMPRCPRHLDAEAKREWKRLAHDLHDAGLLSRVDRPALAAYCQLYSRWARAERELARTGLTAVAGNGALTQHPLVAVANTALDGMRRYLIEFGMTPSSRSRLHVVLPAKEKTFEQMLSEAVSALPLPKEKVDARAD